MVTTTAYFDTWSQLQHTLTHGHNYSILWHMVTTTAYFGHYICMMDTFKCYQQQPFVGDFLLCKSFKSMQLSTWIPFHNASVLSYLYSL